MKMTITTTLFALALLSAATAQASEILVHFDDLNATASDYLYPIPNGYSGLNWDNFGATHEDEYDLSGYKNGTVSGTNTAYNGASNPATISSDSLFNLNSAIFTAAWNNGLTIDITGRKGGEAGSIVGQISFQVDAKDGGSHGIQKKIDFNWKNIDYVHFASSGGTNAGFPAGSATHFAMDNLRYEPVPEPGTLGLFVCSLVGLVGRRRRRK